MPNLVLPALLVIVAFSFRSFAAFELVNDAVYHPGAALNGPKDLARAANGTIWMIEDTASEAVAPRGTPSRPRDSVVRLADDGTFDPGFTPWRIYGQLTFLSPTPDGGVLVGGQFPSVATSGLARISGDGTLARFDARLPGTARHAVAQANGKILVLLETHCTQVVRLNLDGTDDPSFQPITLADCGIRLALQPDHRILVLVSGGLQRFLADGQPDPTFSRPRFAGRIGFDPVDWESIILAEEDGRLLVTGHFDTVNGIPRDKLVRLLSDGSVDPDFVPPRLPTWGSCSPNGCVARIFDLHSAGHGGYWVLGAFEQAADWPCRALLRLNGDGSVDPRVSGIKPFFPGTVGSDQPVLAALGHLRDMVPLADGRLLVGVHSAMVDVWGQPDVGMHTGLARILGPDIPAIQLSDVESAGVEDARRAWIEVRRWGALDQAQSFRLRLATNDLAEPAIPESDYLPLPELHRFDAGEWTQRVPLDLVMDGRPEPQKRLHVILSDPDPSIPIGQATNSVVLYDDDRVGAPDPAFHLRGDWPRYVSSVVELPNGDGFLVGHEGTDSNLVALWSSADGHWLRRWPGAGATERLLFAAPLADGKVIAFMNHLSAPSSHPLLLLGADGTPDPAFRPPAALASWSQIQRLVNQPDGKFLILGAELVNHRTVGRIARLDATGRADPAFRPPDFGSGIAGSAAVDSEGRLLVAGTFATVNQVTRPGLVRLAPNGALDETYTPPAGLNVFADPEVAVLAIQRDGKALIRVSTVTFGGKTTSGMVRLLPNGEVDLEFIQGRGGQGVGAAAVLPDQRILVGGTFANYHGLARARLAMLLPDGAIDTTFKADESATPYFTSFALSRGGWVWVGGWFSNDFPYLLDSTAKACVVRILAWQVPRWVSASTSPSSGGRLTFTTRPGAQAFLESSADLSHWKTIGTNLATDGTLTMDGFREPAAPSQYLRLRIE